MSHPFEHLELIEELLRQPSFGFITDVDGTISKTAPTPQEAEVSPLFRQYLSILCNHLALVAAVSGRPAVEAGNLVKVDGMVYIGNHGLDRWAKGHAEFINEVRDYPKAIKALVEELKPLLSIEGIIIENKGVTATIHYRLCANHEATKRDILKALKNSTHAKNLQTMPGRMSINLLPPVKVNKGTTTLNLIQEYNLKSGIYIGDDVTDIDAFRAIRTATHNSNFRGFAIGVVSQEMPENLIAEADFTLNGVSEVERFLKWMSQTAAELS